MALELELDEIFKEGMEDEITVNSQAVNVILSLNEEAIGDEGIVELTGTMLLTATDYDEHFVPESGVVNTFTWQEETFHVLPSPATRHGVTTCRIRRHSQHQKRAGYTDMNDEQATWAT